MDIQLTFDGHSYATVYINWEEYGCGNFGLYGTMKTQDQKVQFNEDTKSLTISDSNYKVVLDLNAS